MDTLARLKTWLATSLNIPEDLIKPESTLDDLFWEKRGTPPDSMDVVQLMSEFEADFALSEDDAENLPSSLFVIGNTTVQQMADWIDKQTLKNRPENG